MKIIVHRGTHQIGGCATEIRTNQNGIIIDAGSELEGNTLMSIPGATEGKSNCDAVLFTHYHVDHIGLIESINDDIPLLMSELTLDILKLQNNRQKLFNTKIIDRITPFVTARTLSFGDIKVTPFMVDHSAFDSHMFLIEADGKKLLHTGDFRTHGFRGKGLLPTLKKYIGDVDVLICEGTTVNRSTKKSKSEFEISTEARKLLAENKYVFIVCASTNIDRIAAFCSAVPRGRYCLCDLYQKTLLNTVNEKAGLLSSLYTFPKMLTYSPALDEKMKQQGFCMFVRPGNYLSSRVMEQFKDKDPLVIYSMWQGYLEKNVSLQNALSGFRIEELHTSGHADLEAIHSVITEIKPKVIIPIHTEMPEVFKKYLETKLLCDGEEIFL